MNRTVSVVDCGSGNLLSVARALEACGAEVSLAETPEGVRAANRLVLPGVGAFGAGMAGLRERGLVGALRDFASAGRPFLGICLGMQMLAEESEEFGLHGGLALISGRVVPVPSITTLGEPQRIPRVGWNEILEPLAGAWRGTILDGLVPRTNMYMVHSYYFRPSDPTSELAVCDYGGHRVATAIQAGSLIGLQFHPEKSGPEGLKVLSRFIAL